MRATAGTVAAMTKTDQVVLAAADVFAVLALDVAGRVVLAHENLQPRAARAAAAELLRRAPHHLRVVATLHRKAAFVVAAFVEPHAGDGGGVEVAFAAGGQVLAVRTAGVLQRTAQRRE